MIVKDIDSVRGTKSEDMWGGRHPTFIKLHCGSIGEFDHGAGYGYRCRVCMAVVGSIAEPKSCKEEREKYKIWEKLGGEKFNNEVE
jgi:hypothetical protein